MQPGTKKENRSIRQPAAEGQNSCFSTVVSVLLLYFNLSLDCEINQAGSSKGNTGRKSPVGF